jgi:hypothetical protein
VPSAKPELRQLHESCWRCDAGPGKDCVTKTGKPTSFHAKPPQGAIEKQVRADIAALVIHHPMGEALSEMSINLARTLDHGAGLAVAAVNRELRENLKELAGAGVDDGDLSDAFSTPDQPEQK